MRRLLIVSSIALTSGGLLAYYLQQAPPSSLPNEWADHVTPHGPLVPLARNLWQVTGQLDRDPDSIKRNMVVYRLPPILPSKDGSASGVGGGGGGDDVDNGGGGNGHDGGAGDEKEKDLLLLHSVIAMNEEGMRELDSLGKVKYILVPSSFHRLDAGVYKNRYPDAQVICPRDIEKAVSKAVHVDGFVEDVLHSQYSSKGINCYRHGFGTFIPELVYELPLDEEDEDEYKSSTDKRKALVFCDLIVNLRDGPWVYQVSQLSTGGSTPIVPWMYRYAFFLETKRSEAILAGRGPKKRCQPAADGPR